MMSEKYCCSCPCALLLVLNDQVCLSPLTVTEAV